MKIWRCTVCGWLQEGESPPANCPRCGAPAEKFVLVDPAEYQQLMEEDVAVAAVSEKREMTPEDKKKIDPALFKISYGLYIVGSVKEGRVNAQVCNTVFQLTSTPMRVALGINKNNLTNEYIKSSGVLTICILGKNAHDMVKNFGFRSGRDADKFENVKYAAGVTGAPVLEDCIAYLECRVDQGLTVDAGTHTIFIAEVVEGGVKTDADPMTYAYYRETRNRSARKQEAAGASRWLCTVCGYVHEGKEPPEKCPYCGAPRDKFIPLKDESGQSAANLAANWDAETEEVGLYLAFGRKADEEGYPEVGEAFYRVALEEGWHAAEIAALQGKVKSTGENLAWRVEAELGARKGKAEAAGAAVAEGNTEAGEFFTRASKDEGRHASIFRGLLERYFKE
ncbi:MAG: flavin reductase [Bacillota bacterium]